MRSRIWVRCLSLLLGLALCLVGLPALAEEKTYEIVITSKPSGAAVFLDRQADPVGVTPLVLQLKPDFYLIDIQLDRYQDEFDILHIEGPPKEKRFHYDLAKAVPVSSFVVTSYPSGAQVFVDSVYQGYTPVTIKNLPVGRTKLLLRKEGYAIYEEMFILTENNSTTTLATLQRDATPLATTTPLLPVGVAQVKTPIYIANQGACCSQAIRQGYKNLLGVWGKGDTLFAVGEGGTIERSDDQGALWKSVRSGTAQGLSSIWGMSHAGGSSSTLFAVGQYGTILRSTDNGTSWTPQESPTTQHLYSVWGSSLDNVYIVGAGGTILNSSDQGKTWVQQESNAFEDLFGVFGRSAKEVYAVGERGKIIRLKGKAWVDLPSETKKDLYAGFASSGSLLAVGKDGAIVRSTDGETWYQQKSGFSSSFYGISRVSEGALYIAGDVLLRSDDDGLSWSKVSLEVSTYSVWASSKALVLLGR